MSNPIRLAGVIRESIVDGPGIRFVVFVQGCPHHCEGCHNPESHDFSGGYDCDPEKILAEIKKNPLLDGVTFSGGEPLCQAAALLPLAKEIKKLGLNLFIYTGSIFEDLLKEQNDLLNEDIHCLKTLLGIVVDKVESERKGNKK